MELDFLLSIPCRTMIFAACLGMLLDIASGLAQAAKNHCLSSEAMRQGLWHKAGFLGLIILGGYVEWVQGMADISDYLGFTFPSLACVCIYIIVTEVVSIAENLKLINSDIGKIITTPGNDEDEEEQYR